MNDLQKLTAHERLAHIVEASARDDFEQVAALERTAPIVRHAVPHTHELRQALDRMALLYAALQLDRWAGMQLVGRSWVTRWEHRAVLQMGAYTFCAYADAWRVFCGALGVDPEAALVPAPGAGTLAFAEIISRRRLPSFLKIEALLRKSSDPAATPITVSKIAAAMRTLFDSWVETSQ